MKHTLYLTIIALFLFCHCGGTTGSSTNVVGTGLSEVGTILTNPKIPSNLLPHFDDYTIDPQVNPLLPSLTESSDTATLNTVMMRSDIMFVLLAHGRLAQEKQKYETFAESAHTALSSTGITEFSSTPQTASMDSAQSLSPGFDHSWILEILRDPIDASFFRIYFKNKNTGDIEALLFGQTDINDTVVKGFFIYVTPALLVENITTPGTRFNSIAFDYTNQDNTYTSMNSEIYHPVLGTYYGTRTQYRCNMNTKKCTWEYFSVLTPAPERRLSAISLRYATEDNLDQLCVQQMEYKDSKNTVLSSHVIDLVNPQGPEAFMQSTCSIDNPLWGNHYFTADDVVLRFEDTTSLTHYYINGADKTQWDKLTPTVIDPLFDASGFLLY